MKGLLIFLTIFFLPAFSSAGQSSQSNAGASSYLNAPVSNQTQVEVSPTFQASKQIRQFPNGPGMVSPGLPTMFMNARPTVEFQPLEQLIKIKKFWTEKEVENFSKSNGFFDVITEMNIVKKYPPTSGVSFAIKLPNNFQYVGQITGKARAGVNSDALFMVAAKKAMEAGGNLLLLATEGAQTYLTTNAWGVSLGYVHVDMGGSNGGGAGAMGIGYARGETEYNHKPFVRFVILRVK